MRSYREYRRVSFICFLVLVSVLSVSLVSCSDKRKQAEADLIRFIVSYERVMVPLTAHIGLTQWDYFQTSDTGCRFRYDSLFRARTLFLHDRESFEYLKRLKEKGKIEDAYLSKQLDILYKTYLPYQADLGLQEEILSLESFLRQRFWQRANDPGIQEAEKILRYSNDDAALYRAWRQIKDPGREIGDSIYKLVLLRNELAREVGFADFYAMRVYMDGLEEVYLDSVFSELKEKSDIPYARMKTGLDSALSRSCSVESIHLGPWNFRGHFFQNGILACDAGRDRYYNYVSMSHMVLRFFASIGLPMDDVMAKSLMDVKDGTLPVFTCFTVDRKDDVRIIGNIQGTENDMRQLLARTGQAAYLKYIPNTLPYLLRYPAAPFLQEGVSCFFSRMAGYSNWILSMGVFSLGQAEELQASYVENLKKEELFGLRWGLFMYEFERSLYSEPKERLGNRWRDLLQDYMLVSSDEGRFGFADWAAESYFSLYAGNFHNVILGELMAAQLLAYYCEICPRIGSVDNPDLVGETEIGKHLQKDLFNPGASKHWKEIVTGLFGEPLDAEAFLHQFVY